MLLKIPISIASPASLSLDGRWCLGGHVYPPLLSPLVCLRRDFPSKRLASCLIFTHLQGGGASDLLVTLEEEPGAHSSAPCTSHPLRSSPPQRQDTCFCWRSPSLRRGCLTLLQVRKPHSLHPMRLLLDPSSSLLLGLTLHFIQKAHVQGQVTVAAPQYKIVLVSALREKSAATSSATS